VGGRRYNEQKEKGGTQSVGLFFVLEAKK